jgi:hypothetical protein
MRERRWPMFVMSLAIGFAASQVLRPSEARADGPASICQPIGCGGGHSSCANVSSPNITYFCYKP